MIRVDENELVAAITDLGVAAQAFEILQMHTVDTCEHHDLIRFMATLLDMYYQRLKAAAGLAPPVQSGPRLVNNGGET